MSFVIIYKAVDHEKFMTYDSWSEDKYKALYMNLRAALDRQKRLIEMWPHMTNRTLKLRWMWVNR